LYYQISSLPCHFPKPTKTMKNKISNILRWFRFYESKELMFFFLQRVWLRWEKRRERGLHHKIWILPTNICTDSPHRKRASLCFLLKKTQFIFNLSNAEQEIKNDNTVGNLIILIRFLTIYDIRLLKISTIGILNKN
jgi:hypothetical protein